MNEMQLVVKILITFLLVGIGYWWISYRKYKIKYGWIANAPGHPIFGNVLDFSNSKAMLNIMPKLVETYDGIFFINLMIKKILVISNPEVLELILTSSTLINKSSDYKFFKRWLGNGLLTANGQKWKKSRKIITPAFHFSILCQFVPIYESNADIMIKLLEKELEKDSFDIYPYVALCSLDIICETAMGVSVNAQTKKNSEYVHSVKEVCKIGVERIFSAIQHFDLTYPRTKNFYKELRLVKTLHSHTKHIIESRKQELKNVSNKKKNTEKGNVYDIDQLKFKKKSSVLDLLLQSKLDGEPLPDWYIREEVDTIMFAGHDTIGSAISFSLHCLAENPEVQNLAVEEQKTIFGNDVHRPMTFQDIQEMKYLELVIKETLRLYPPAPFFLRISDTDVKYKDGKILPKNTSFFLFVYGLHRNPKVFPNPEKFNPNRFEKFSPFVFLPFSAGLRSCIGQKFAMQEIKTVLSKVLRNYELLPASPKHNIILNAEGVLKSENGIKIQIKRRNWD